MKITLNHILSKGLITLALLAGISLVSVTPAKAIALDYTVTGPVSGMLNADLSDPTSSFLDWSLTTYTHTYTPSESGVTSNNNLALFQTVYPDAFSFVITSASTYAGTFSGYGSSGYFTGNYVQKETEPNYSNTPEAGTNLLLLAGLGMVCLAARYLKTAWF
jgi:hypothetical protein